MRNYFSIRRRLAQAHVTAHRPGRALFTSAPQRYLGGRVAIGLLGLLRLLSQAAQAQTLAPEFGGRYQVVNQGPVPQSDPFVFVAGTSERILMAPGSGTEEAIREYGLLRDLAGKITGFATPPRQIATAHPLSEADRVGWLSYGPGEVLLFRGGFDTPTLGQLKPGSTSPDVRTKLADLGVDRCCYGGYGQTKIVPAGFPGAGRLKSTAGSFWYDSTATLKGDGTLALGPLESPVELSDGFLGQNFVFVAPGLPGVTKASLLISFSDSRLYLFELDSHGDPVPATKRVFMENVTELGDTDPRTGDFLMFTGDPQSLVVVSPGQGIPPVIHLGEPAAGTGVNTDTRVVFTGTAGQENGALASLSLLQDGVEVDVNKGPFNATDGQVGYFLASKLLATAGSYEFHIVATAGDGNSSTSAPVRITATVAPNQLPIATLTADFPGTSRFLCQGIPLTVSGSDPDGSVKNMYLLDGPKLLKTLTPTGGRVVLRDLALGTHTLTLQVQDNRGGLTTASLTLQILPPLLNRTAGDFRDDGRFGFCFTGEPGKAYRAEWSDATAGLATWNSLERRVAAQDPLIWVDPTFGGEARVYRVRLVP